MGEPLLNESLSTERMEKESPFASLLTRVLIEAICPTLKSDILFGQMLHGPFDEKFHYWIDANVKGDFTGRIGLGADKVVLRTLATHLGCVSKSGNPDLKEALLVLHEALAHSFEKIFGLEDLRCELSKASGLREDYRLHEAAPFSVICPIDTRWGEMKVYVALKPVAPELQEELAQNTKSLEARKIRVYASQLETLYSAIRQLETLEQQALTRPPVRLQVRSHIKKVKRMVQHMKSEPLDTLFSPARKLVMEVGKQRGKQVKFVSHGTWLFLDKRLLNYVYEPVLHLIRNAVDHGIEAPVERERVGKNATGQIKAMASFSQGMLRLIICDDGGGLDYGMIRDRAISKGILDPEAAAEKSNEELRELIFFPGFSTRSKVDSMSGRGFGLDIVRDSIVALGGTLKILSTSNHGTSFEISIPLTDDTVVHAPVMVPADPAPASPETDSALFIDEMNGYFERLSPALVALATERSPKIALEVFRILHSIKGVSGFLGWQRVAGFCHEVEDFIKLVAEEKLPVDEENLAVVTSSCTQIKDFCEATKLGAPYSLYTIRQLESQIKQRSWAVSDHGEKNRISVGKIHLRSVEEFLLPLAKKGSFSVRPEADVSKAIALPYGALVQFNGDQRGFAGIFLSERTFSEVIYPFATGKKADLEGSRFGVKRQLWALTEFANLMGNQMSEASSQTGLNLQSAAPVTYFGWGQPLRMLGTPTYCYACELNGNPFYLAGDFRSPKDVMDQLPPKDLNYQPQSVLLEGQNQCRNYLTSQGLNVLFNEVPTQSDLIGFDGGMTAVISCESAESGVADTILFLSFESTLASHVLHQFQTGMKDIKIPKVDLFDCIQEAANLIGGQLVSELDKKKIAMKLSPPSLFVGKAYVANFNRLFVTNKLVGTTPKGKLELQILVTELT